MTYKNNAWKRTTKNNNNKKSTETQYFSIGEIIAKQKKIAPIIVEHLISLLGEKYDNEEFRSDLRSALSINFIGDE